MRDELSRDSVSSSRRGCGRWRSSALWRLSAPQWLELQPGIGGGELSEVLIAPARSRSAPCTRTCTGPLQVLAFVSLSLPRGVTAGGNHGVRSRRENWKRA